MLQSQKIMQYLNSNKHSSINLIFVIIKIRNFSKHIFFLSFTFENGLKRNLKYSLNVLEGKINGLNFHGKYVGFYDNFFFLNLIITTKKFKYFKVKDIILKMCEYI